jgi:hypothetical protein
MRLTCNAAKGGAIVASEPISAQNAVQKCAGTSTMRKSEPSSLAGSRSLIRLREAASIGIADIEANRFRVFDTPGQLTQHLGKIVERVLSRRARTGMSQD